MRRERGNWARLSLTRMNRGHDEGGSEDEGAILLLVTVGKVMRD